MSSLLQLTSSARLSSIFMSLSRVNGWKIIILLWLSLILLSYNRQSCVKITDSCPNQTLILSAIIGFCNTHWTFIIIMQYANFGFWQGMWLISFWPWFPCFDDLTRPCICWPCERVHDYLLIIKWWLWENGEALVGNKNKWSGEWNQ